MSDLSLRQRFAAWLMGLSHEQFAAVTAKPIRDDADGHSEGFMELGQRGVYDQPAAVAQKFYLDALEAWRENPQVKRIVDVVTDFVLGDGIRVSSTIESLNTFIDKFTNHRKNREYLVELERPVDELTRAGDLFVLLWLNRVDGMSYVRLIPKEQILQIDTADNDPDEEIAYWQRPMGIGEQPRKWMGAFHPEAAQSDHIMLHYAINRPVGAQFGTSDLSTLLQWIQTYVQTLNGRAKLHWAMRLFYWIVTVPKSAMAEARKRYATPPAAGSVIVAEQGEEWTAVTPNIGGADASHDLEALRHMIYAGTGFPAIWLGESGTSNLSEAREMRSPAERHLKRRQNYVSWMLQDIAFHAYRRAAEIGKQPALKSDDYDKLFMVQVTEVSREDNVALAQAGEHLSSSMKDLRESLQGMPVSVAKKLAGLWFKFIGEPLENDELQSLVDDFFAKAMEEEDAESDA